MLLTRKSSGPGSAPISSLVSSLERGVGRAIPTMDRRAFLRRSGMGVGVGLAASQLTLVKKAKARNRRLDRQLTDALRELDEIKGSRAFRSANRAQRVVRAARSRLGR